MSDQRKAFKPIDHVLVIIRNNDFHDPIGSAHFRAARRIRVPERRISTRIRLLFGIAENEFAPLCAGEHEVFVAKRRAASAPYRREGGIVAIACD
jgi:hypothetical protein